MDDMNKIRREQDGIHRAIAKISRETAEIYRSIDLFKASIEVERPMAPGIKVERPMMQKIKGLAT